jgi:hypothetical protein
MPTSSCIGGFGHSPIFVGESSPVNFRRFRSAALGGLLLALLVQASTEVAAEPPLVTIRISMAPVAHIDPHLYGINFNWQRVGAARFPAWNAALRRWARYTLIHFPGGWNSEHYDWAANQELRWVNHLGRPYGGEEYGRGVDPSMLLKSVPEADFVTPSLPATRNPASLPDVARLSAQLVSRYGIGRAYAGHGVKIWDIGNEWWLQRGGKRHPWARAENLQRYAALVAAAVPMMEAADPAIDIFAGADWQDPGEFAELRARVGPRAWGQLAGVSVHTYCGMTAPPLCASIPAAMARIRSITGKDRVFDSQWLVKRGSSEGNFGIRNANFLVSAIQDLALARMAGAIIWPVTDFVPELNFISADYSQPYASGLLFGWMAKYYEGEALGTEGELPAAAARSTDGVTVIVAARNSGPRTVRIPLQGTGLSAVTRAKVLYSTAPDDPLLSRIARIANLPATIIRQAGKPDAVQFVVNPGTPGRGSGWEIARVTLH